MKPCFFTQDAAQGDRFLYSFFIYLSVLTAWGLTVYVLFDSNRLVISVGSVVFVGLISLLLCFACRKTVELVCPKCYELSHEGITIQYGKLPKKLHPWSSVSHVCLCELQIGLPQVVIWVAFGPVRKGPLLKGTFGDTTDYRMCDHFHVLLAEYSPERLREFEYYYPGEIPDYRELTKHKPLTSEQIEEIYKDLW